MSGGRGGGGGGRRRRRRRRCRCQWSSLFDSRAIPLSRRVSARIKSLCTRTRCALRALSLAPRILLRAFFLPLLFFPEFGRLRLPPRMRDAFVIRLFYTRREGRGERIARGITQRAALGAVRFPPHCRGETKGTAIDSRFIPSRAREREGTRPKRARDRRWPVTRIPQLRFSCARDNARVNSADFIRNRCVIVIRELSRSRCCIVRPYMEPRSPLAVG